MLNFFSSAFSVLWNAVISVIDLTFAALISLVGHVLVTVIDVAFFFIEELISFLPDLDAPILSTGLEIFVFANQYIPLTEAVSLLSLWGSVYAWTSIWKLLHFRPL